MRERSKKEAQLTSMTRDIILHLIFVFLLAIVSYGNNNGNRFLMTTEMRNRITKFNLVRLWFLLNKKGFFSRSNMGQSCPLGIARIVSTLAKRFEALGQCWR